MTEGTEMSHSLWFGNMNEASLSAACAPVFYYYYYYRTREWGLALHGES